MVLGKKRRDKLYYEHRIGFNSFLYLCLKTLRLSDLLLLRIKVPKYNYSFCCRINNEDFTFMTGHEHQIVKYFEPKIGDTVIDVGAHIGHYTLIGANRVGSTGKVIAIEADPANFEILNKNIRFNCLKNVSSVNCAAYSEKSKVKLYTPHRQSGFSIYNTVISTRANPRDQYVEVDSDTLDNVLIENKIDLSKTKWIKIDVEGAELEVLKGSHALLSRNEDIHILVEIHSQQMYKSVVGFLTRYKFRVECEIGEGEWRHIKASKVNSS